MSVRAIDLAHAVVHLDAEAGAKAVPIDPDFWTDMDPRLSTGRMVSRIVTDADWPSWERHPTGEEIIHQLEGAMLLILDTGGGHERIALRCGATAIVPRGVWHTADVIEPGAALYITPGAGTQTRPR